MRLEDVLNKVERPSIELVNTYKLKFEKDERYSNEDKIQKLITTNVFDKEKYETVLITVILINELYSTSIFRTDLITNHIFKNIDNIHTLIETDDSAAIKAIAQGHGIGAKEENNKEEWNFYSFASKYCNYFNPDSFPIYDSYVDKMLWAYKIKDNFQQFKKIELKDYAAFRNIIKDFQNYYHLNNFSMRDIDKFLWLYGKEIFAETNK